MQIHSNFDGGNISVSINSDLVLLNIEKDNQSDFFQWFYFRASNLTKQNYAFCIQNAGKSSYPKGWEDYSVRVSEDGENWFCCSTNGTRWPRIRNGMSGWSTTSDTSAYRIFRGHHRCIFQRWRAKAVAWLFVKFWRCTSSSTSGSRPRNSIVFSRRPLMPIRCHKRTIIP